MSRWNGRTTLEAVRLGPRSSSTSPIAYAELIEWAALRCDADGEPLTERQRTAYSRRGRCSSVRKGCPPSRDMTELSCCGEPLRWLVAEARVVTAGQAARLPVAE